MRRFALIQSLTDIINGLGYVKVNTGIQKQNGKEAFMQNIGKKLYRDIALVLFLLILALSVFIIWRVTRENGEWAVVYVDGEEVYRYSLSLDGEYELNGGTNVLVIESGKAYMKFADCPDKKCVNMGKKSLSGESIVCLPNRVEVRILGGEEILVSGVLSDKTAGADLCVAEGLS